MFILVAKKVSAQQQFNFCGDLPFHQASTSNPDSIVFDRFGNTYDKFNFPQPLGADNCIVGYFNLIFNDVPLEYQNVVCNVFEELSTSIPRRINTYGCTPPENMPSQELVVIHVRIITSNIIAAAASAIYTPNVSNCNPQLNWPLNPSNTYNTINGGRDYINPDAILHISDYWNWNFSYVSPPQTTELDLRSVILHEALHIYGFSPIISQDGKPQNAITNFDFYDHYLYAFEDNNPNNLIKIIEGNGFNNCWHLNNQLSPNEFNEIVTDNCSQTGDFSIGLGNPIIAISAGKDDFNTNQNPGIPQLLSHLSAICNTNGPNLVMQPTISLGIRRAIISIEEMDILCQLGYSINNNPDCCHQVTYIESAYSTNNNTCCSNFYFTCENSILIIPTSELLCNDASGGVMELTDVFDYPFVQLTNNQIIFTAVQQGQFLVGYTVKSCDGKMDNAYFEVYVGPCLDCNNEAPCQNLICTYDFDEFITDEIAAVYSLGGLYWVFNYPSNNDPNEKQNTVDICLDANNNKYMSFFYERHPQQGTEYREGIAFKLKEPIMPGCELVMNFESSVYNHLTQLIILGSANPPCKSTDALTEIGCIQTICNSSAVFQPRCLNQTPFIIDKVGSNIYGSCPPDLTEYNPYTFKYTNPANSDLINYVILYIESNEEKSGIYLDKLRITSNCACSNFNSTSIKCDEFNFEAENCSLANTYLWKFGDPLSGVNNESTLNPTSHLFSANGTYTVTLTVTDLCGNTKSASSQIEVNCPPPIVCNCPADYYIGVNPNSEVDISLSQIPASLAYKTICINGKLNIDRANQIFSHCTILFGPGASIAIQSGSRLSTLYSTYRPCNGIMYQGIIAESGSRIFALNNTIEYAEIGIKLQSGSSVVNYLNGNTFRHNHIGISMPHGGDFTSPEISNNDFICPAGLLPPRSGELSFAGIYMDGALAVISNCNFNRLRNGIICQENSLAFVEDNCTITDMIPENSNSSVGQADGVGIFVDKSIISVSNCTIVNALIGIHSNYSWLINVSEDTIADCRNGIYDRFSFGPGVILDNRLSEYREQGIRIESPMEGIYFTINDNKLYNVNAQPSGQMEAAAIFLDNVRSQSALIPSQLVQNIVTQKSSYQGIFARNCDNIAAQSNEIQYSGYESFGNSGIVLQNVIKSAFYSNIVDGQMQNNLISAAFHASMSPMNTYCCNDVNYTGYGFAFSGDCDRSVWRQNLLRSHYRSLFIENGSYFGLQPDILSGNISTSPGDQWNGSLYPLGGSYEAYNGNTSPFVQRLSQIYPHSCNSPFWPSSIFPGQSCSFNPDQWFVLSENIVEDCATDDGCPPLDFGNPLSGNDNYLTRSDTVIAQGEFLLAEHGSCLNFEGQRRLFSMLHEHPELRVPQSPLDSFYLANLNTDLYRFYKIDSLKYKAMSYSNSDLEGVLEGKDSIVYYASVLKYLDSLYTEATTLEDSIEIENHIEVTESILEGLKLEITEEVNQFKQNKSPNITLAESLNNEIIANDLLYSNLVAVNRILLQTIGRDIDTLTSGQRDSLLYIANQCPLDGGKSVYMARSLYNLYGPLDINDDSICQPVLPIIITNTQQLDKLEVSYFPVPSKEALKFQFPEGRYPEVEISLIDVPTGKTIKIYNLGDIIGGEINLRIHDITTGMYIFTLKTKGETVSTGKIVITK